MQAVASLPGLAVYGILKSLGAKGEGAGFRDARTAVVVIVVIAVDRKA